jgi:ATP-dependent RNA helicase DeaD
MPSAKEIFKNKVQHWIKQIKNTPVKSDLQPYLGDVQKGFEDLDKETLIELMLSKEFHNFDLNPKNLSLNQEKNSDKSSDRKINAPKDKDRFFINVGARDQYEWTTLKDFIRSYLNLGMDDVFQVEVMKNFSFFSTHKKHRDLVLKSFENLNLDSRRISVELTKKGKTFSPKKKKKSNYATKSKKRFN